MFGSRCILQPFETYNTVHTSNYLHLIMISYTLIQVHILYSYHCINLIPFVHSYHATTSRAYQAYNHSSKSAVPFDSAQDVRYHSRLLDWPSNVLGLHTKDRIIHEHFQLQVCRLKRIHENSILQPFAAKCILSKHAEISAKYAKSFYETTAGKPPFGPSCGASPGHPATCWPFKVEGKEPSWKFHSPSICVKTFHPPI